MKKSLLFALGMLITLGGAFQSADAQNFIPVRTKKIRASSSHNIYMGISGFNFNGSFRYAYEWATGDNFALVAGVGFRGDIRSVGMDVPVIPKDPVLRLSPTVSLEPRFYYNFSRRDDYRKSTYLNSGNFVSIEASCVLPAWYHKPDYASKSYFSLSPRWGLRRVYNDNFAVEFHAGLTAISDTDEFAWGPDVGVRIGFAF